MSPMDELNEVLPSEEIIVRADRRHHGDAQRDGHQCRRERGGRRGARKPRPTRTSRGGELAEGAGTARRHHAKPASRHDRTDDPVRMYLREMGSVELLSREGEIAIAKRIEAGRETMIARPVRKPADLPGHHRLARRAERRQDPAARHHRPRSDLRAAPTASSTPKADDAAPPSAAAAAPMPARERMPPPRRRRKPPPRRLRRRRAAAADGRSTTRTTWRTRVAVGAWKPSCKPQVLETLDRIADALQEAAQAAGRRTSRTALQERDAAAGQERKLQEAAQRDHRPTSSR